LTNIVKNNLSGRRKTGTKEEIEYLHVSAIGRRIFWKYANSV
jgi:hypothetical protein